MTTDERLQRLRRAWDEGDPETRVRLLRERMRAGELREERVRLAAYLGDEVARASLDEAPLAHPDPAIFAAGLESCGQDVAFRSLLAVANRCFEAHGGEPDRRDALSDLLRDLEAWVLCPCRRHASRVRHCERYSSCLRPAGGSPEPGLPDDLAAHVLRIAAAVSDPQQLRGALITMAIRLGVEAIHDELVPWALGLRDPVAERVAAREAAGG